MKTASIDSNWAERDKHLRGEDFLEVEKFPSAMFKSSKYDGDASGGEMHGMLTLHGVTKPMILDVKVIGEGRRSLGRVPRRLRRDRHAQS